MISNNIKMKIENALITIDVSTIIEIQNPEISLSVILLIIEIANKIPLEIVEKK